MKPKLLPYILGLSVLGILTLILLVMVIVKAGDYKYDQKLFNQANAIASKINNYVDKNSSRPTNLRQAGVSNVPSGISYAILPSGKYRFCVDYRGSYSSLTATLEQQLFNVIYGPSQGNGGTGNYPTNSYLLIINPYYHKGENCQTITPMVVTPFGSSGSNPFDQCNAVPPNDSTAYSACISQVNSQLNNQTSGT